jgi:dihydrofolate reductase
VSRLFYSAIASLDGYVADEHGSWDWSAPDAEVHAAVNDLARPAGTHLYGRRMYDVLVAWETIDDPDPAMRDFAQIWRAAEKVVYSRTLQAPMSARTRIEREFDVEAVRALKERADRDLLIGGPELAAQAIEAGLVDELHLFLSPVVVGAGKRALRDGLRLDLELTAERRFGNGVVHLGYRA